MKNKQTVWQSMATAPKDEDIIIGLKSNFGLTVGLDIVSFQPNRHNSALNCWYSDMTDIVYSEHPPVGGGRSIIGWTPLPVLSSWKQ